MVDVKPLRAHTEVQIDARPVVDFRVVDAGHAGLSAEIRQRPVGRLDLGIVRHADLQLAGAETHALCQEVPILLRVDQPVRVFLLDLLPQVRDIGQRWVRHEPVIRVVDLLPILKAADEREIAALRLRLVLEEDPPSLGYKIVQRAIRHVAVRCEHPDARLSDLAQTGDKNLVVVVVFKSVDFVKDDFAGTHTIPPLGVVGAALHHTLVLPTLHHLFGVVIVPVELRLPLGGFKDFGKILHRRDRLLLVVGAHVHVIVFHGVVGGYGARAVEGDETVLACTATHHAEQLLPPRPPVGSVGAVPQREEKLLPRE